MDMRQLSVLCLVIVLGLAGCSGLSPFGSDVSYPDGYNESGITDAETAANQHSEALSEHDNYTLEMNVTGTEGTGETGFTFRVDEANEQATMNLSVEGEEESMSIERYQDENTTYEKTEMPTFGTVYDTTEEPAESFQGNLTNHTDMEPLFANGSFEEAGTVTRDDETLLRYNATDIEDPDAFINTSEISNDSIESFNSTVLVNEEGIVRSFEFDMTYTADGETEEASLMIRVTDIDSTTVKEPDWLEEAEAAAQNDSDPFESDF